MRLRLTRHGPDTFVERLPWAECVERYDRPHTLFYMDPPYWGTEGYGVPFELGEYDRMAALLARLKGRAIVTVNDIPAMRRAFKGSRWSGSRSGIRWAGEISQGR